MIVRGPDATVKWPRYSKVMDYELEFGIVTRRTRANIPPARRAIIFSATRSSTISRRATCRWSKWKGRLGPAKGKSFDGANVLGPWIVTPDEIGDPQTLQCRGPGQRRNPRAAAATAGMLFSFEEILAHASQDETIHAGEVLRLRHGRQLLRPRNRPLSRTWRYDRTARREHRRAPQQGWRQGAI